MPFYKATFFFAQGKYGWTETWYRSEADYDDALDNAKELGTKRAAMLGHLTTGAAAYLHAVRVSDTIVQRDSLLHQWKEGITGSWPDATYAADHPEVAILIRCESGALYRRASFLHGNPDKLWASETYVQDAVWFARFAAWQTEILQRGWLLRVLDKAKVPIAITTISVAAPGGRIRLSMPAGSVVGASGRVRVSGVINARDINGLWYYELEGANTISLVGSDGILPPAPYMGGARLREQTYTYVPCDNIVIRGVRTREAGIPFDSPRGRRRARV